MRRPIGVLGHISRKPHIITGAAPSVAINIQTPELVLCRKATKIAANAKHAVTPTNTPPLGIIKSIANITNAATNSKTAITSNDKFESSHEPEPQALAAYVKAKAWIAASACGSINDRAILKSYLRRSCHQESSARRVPGREPLHPKQTDLDSQSSLARRPPNLFSC